MRRRAGVSSFPVRRLHAMADPSQFVAKHAQPGSRQGIDGLDDLVLEIDGDRIPLSLPDEGPSRLRLGGTLAFGFAATDEDRVRRLIGRTGTLFNVRAEPVGSLTLREVAADLDVVSGDLSFDESAAHV
jgi:hypothetical protein